METRKAQAMRELTAMMLLGAILAIGTSAAPSAAQESSPLDAETIAVEAYVYLYPLVLMDITRLQTTNYEAPKGLYGPMGTFAHAREFPPSNFKAVVRPNFDTLYSILWMDLTKEPMIVSIPDSQGRYYLAPALDMWTDVTAVPGKRTTGTEAGNFAYVPPRWTGSLPEGVTRIDATTRYMWMILRTQTNGTKDYDNVHKFQDRLKATPLSRWGKKPAPVRGVVDPKVDMKTPPVKQVVNMSPEQFFEYAARLMKLHRPHATDYSQVWRLQRIGIVPGEDFDFNKLDPSVQQALNKAPAAAMKVMQAKVPTLARVANGWSMNTDTMGVYGNYYLKRACVALVGLGANQEADAVYPIMVASADAGDRLLIHFDKDELPPVDAFWSFTMYDKDGFPVPNPLNRCAIGDRDPLKYNPDGSLDLHVQVDSPGKDKESNWLPAPNEDGWNLTMRLYAPKRSVLDGTWNPPALKRVGGEFSQTHADGLPPHRRAKTK